MSHFFRPLQHSGTRPLIQGSCCVYFPRWWSLASFSCHHWNEETKPPVVDTEGSPVVDNGTPLYSGSKVKLAFYQKPYILKDGITYGTSLKLQGIQIVTVNGSAGVDTGDLSDAAVAEMFGKTQGFKAGDPNVTVKEEEVGDDDF